MLVCVCSYMYVMLHVYICVLNVCMLEFHTYIESMLEFRACILYLSCITFGKHFFIALAVYWPPFVTNTFKQFINLFCCCCCLQTKVAYDNFLKKKNIAYSDFLEETQLFCLLF